MPNTINIYPGNPILKVLTDSKAIPVASPLLNVGVYEPQGGPVIIKETVGIVKVLLSSEAVSVSGIPTEIGVYSPAGPPWPIGPPGAGLIILGTVATAANLPTTGNSYGDLWIAQDTGHGWLW